MTGDRLKGGDVDILQLDEQQLRVELKARVVAMEPSGSVRRDPLHHRCAQVGREVDQPTL
jgi:hypothetical protein